MAAGYWRRLVDTNLQAPDDMAGQAILCTRCNATLSVPAPSVSEAVVVPPPPRPRPDSAPEVEKVQRQTQAALDLNKDRLARANTKLESVQNSQEFQAANKEIDQLQLMPQSFDKLPLH